MICSPFEMRVEVLAQTFIEEAPKIEKAMKAFISLVAARSMAYSTQCSSDEVIVAATAGSFSCSLNDALLCARFLLTAINSYQILDDDLKLGLVEKMSKKETTEKKVIQVVWNRILEQTQKPSKIFGRSMLRVVFPGILKQFEQQPKIKSSNTVPSCMDGFLMEFDRLLQFQKPLCFTDDITDDSKLIWGLDGGESELMKRVEQRTKNSNDRKKRAASNESFVAGLPEILEE
mmetsp:Transcript_22327/g.31982  ORF Transcript_22327/g.31982 Transcript_22327/m.31982 type:complete len:232 (-) Transcript_22327:313-1008(-)|eukprot:CAMPEP_0172417308 /NCGR_PEP_ID=MMETSP1064-20121228/3833_1 /TAXON_ID=202472 /ORGANISM="Aulacoseira subarctica , Strain CCAP 1002/5" /LENGTH=231 /DNA_ID=CAMNT_0013155561 /DNA_START=342 /DNA_END=1037 /DNA_ORIENTATION=+